MSKRTAICCVSILLVGLAAAGLVGCTRAKPELATPTVAVTPTRAVVPTKVLTPQVSSTEPTVVAGPTVISVAETSPTPTLATTTEATPTAPSPTAAPVPEQLEYAVEWLDTLYSIARRFNTTVDGIVALNGLQDAHSIQVGQVLRIAGTASPTSGGTLQEYVVQHGDTLFSIGQRYGVTVDAISRANGIVNPWFISVGQTLLIPEGGPSAPLSGNAYVVQPGDTMYSIAVRFGKNVWDIIVANNLADPHWISVGQVLIIPS